MAADERVVPLANWWHAAVAFAIRDVQAVGVIAFGTKPDAPKVGHQVVEERLNGGKLFERDRKFVIHLGMLSLVKVSTGEPATVPIPFYVNPQKHSEELIGHTGLG